jgi:FkbM family methyltransferase
MEFVNMKNYSQNNEQYFILKYFAKYTGTFLDLGSYNGVDLSNVRALAELGWNGVMVEASPVVYKELKKNYSDYPNIQLVNCAVGRKTEKINFYDNHNAVGTLHKTETLRWKEEKFETVEIPCVEINELLSICHYKTFDFISCDIEGEDLSVMKRLDFNKLKTKMVCVEWNGKDKNLYDDILLPYGFKLMHKNGENLIYYRKILNL